VSLRRIAFFGNCQAGILSNLYGERFASRHAHEARWIKSWLPLEPEDEEWLASCDLILEQLSNLAFVSNVDRYRSGVRIERFPSVCLGFLWPFGNDPHPLNHAIDYRPQGPYEMNDGDRHLNARIRAGTAADVALEEYLQDTRALSPARIDRYHELYMEQQRTMDEKTGFDFAGPMEARFRTEQLFSTAYHPCLDFARLYVSSVLSRFTVSRIEAQDAAMGLARSPFPPGELPVHPLIAKQLGLTWASDERRYATFTGERVTHRQYFTHYLAFEWNRHLADLLQRARSPQPEEADALIDELQNCPGAADSAAACAALGNLLMQRRRFAEAAAQLERAVQIEGPHADVLNKLALCHAALEDFERALDVVDQSLQLAPMYADGLQAFSQILASSGRRDEAINVARKSMRMFPDQASHLCQLAGLLLDAGDVQQAIDVVGDGRHKWPDIEQLQVIQVKALRQQNDIAAALQAADGILAMNPSHGEAAALSALMLMDQGEHAAAERRLREALELRPDAELLNLLGRALSHQGHLEAAREVLLDAVSRAPEHPYYVAHLGDLALQLGEVEQARECLRKATTLAPDDERLRAVFQSIEVAA
jgi:tetratricopeptide (TPR) repeat protein